jgi:hypothetical protein
LEHKNIKSVVDRRLETISSTNRKKTGQKTKEMNANGRRKVIKNKISRLKKLAG